MPFRTHTEGGSWSGGGTEVPNCNVADRAAIRTAIADVAANGSPPTRALGLTGLADCLNGKTEAVLNIDCRGGSCGSAFGTAVRNSNELNMCPPALPGGGTQNDTNVTFFHEVVHCCGGMEIDSWALENHCYAGRGALSPSGTTRAGFMTETSDAGGGLRAGTYVVWEPSTGRVFVKISSGGSWNSGPSISRGTELSVPLGGFRLP